CRAAIVPLLRPLACRWPPLRKSPNPHGSAEWCAIPLLPHHDRQPVESESPFLSPSILPHWFAVFCACVPVSKNVSICRNMDRLEGTGCGFNAASTGCFILECSAV